MDKSWIKLYRKAKENKVMQDMQAWFLFSWILLSVNKDTGEWDVGRIKLANLCGLSQSSVYRTLKKLEEKYQLLKIISNNKYSTIRVVKWASYQSGNLEVNSVSNNKRTTSEQQANTIQEYKNIRSREKNEILEDSDFQKLIGLKGSLTDSQMRMKMALENSLEYKFPTWKYKEQWDQAMKYKKQNLN
jgi:hypothetical protein